MRWSWKASLLGDVCKDLNDSWEWTGNWTNPRKELSRQRKQPVPKSWGRIMLAQMPRLAEMRVEGTGAWMTCGRVWGARWGGPWWGGETHFLKVLHGCGCMCVYISVFSHKLLFISAWKLYKRKNLSWRLEVRWGSGSSGKAQSHLSVGLPFHSHRTLCWK